MKAVVQRVWKASVEYEGEVVGCIGQGMTVLLGIGREDTEDDIFYIVRKILGARMWFDNDNSKHWCRNIRQIEGSILLISQFTLMHVMKGNKPDFHHAMNAEEALKLFNLTRDKLQNEYMPERVFTGKFQHYMNVEQSIDGPVTLLFDSKSRI